MNYGFFSEPPVNPQLGYNLTPNNVSQVTPQTKMEIIPGGVSYTFVSPTSITAYHSVPFQSSQPRESATTPNLTIEQQIAIKQLELQQLESILLKEQLAKKPYENKFHLNKKLSTSDIKEMKLIGKEELVNTIEKTEIAVQTEKKANEPENIWKKQTNCKCEYCCCKESSTSMNVRSSNRRKHKKGQ